MVNHIPQINGALLRMRREELGWALADLATRACLSNKQVKQIEEGGTSSFYSETVKVTAAKKVGGILGLPAQSVFVVEEPEVVVNEPASLDGMTPHTSDDLHADPSGSDKAHTDPPATTGQYSNDSNESQKDMSSPAVKPHLKSPSIETSVIQKSTNSALDSEDKPKSKNSLWFIIALFAAALGLAAVMQKPAPTPPVEPPPPLQVLPSEQPEPAASAPAISTAPSITSTPSIAPNNAPVNVVPAARPAVVVTPASAPSASQLPASSTASSAPATTQTAPVEPSASKPQ
jgi:transcriptional regulator with XRE-family HTH domain